jgi:hypothetical protein
VATTLAEVLARFGPQYLREHALSAAQARAWRGIVACRTPALGGQRLRCDGCGAADWRWHSCRNRHCPRCGARAREAWRAARMAELLAVPYCHLVFTLPHELNALAVAHPRWVYDTLLQCTAATLTEFAANPRWLGGTGAFTLVLHTWTQDLRRHIHVHALMACGALEQVEPSARWIEPRRGARFLFPVHALSRVLRGKFCAALAAAERAGALARDPQSEPAQRRARAQALRAHDWVVYAKTPLAGPAAVLDYLARYTQRTAIGHERLVAIRGERVLLRVRAEQAGCAKRIVAIDGAEFVRRFLQHVLPPGFKRIRHYGLLAPAAKAQRLTAARRLLGMPAPNPRAREEAAQFMRRVAAIDIERCPHCNLGHWRVVQSSPADRAALARTGPAPQAQPRGPPL